MLAAAHARPWRPSGKTIQSSLGQSIMDGFSSGFDNVGKIWDGAFASLASSAKKSLADVMYAKGGAGGACQFFP